MQNYCLWGLFIQKAKGLVFGGRAPYEKAMFLSLCCCEKPEIKAILEPWAAKADKG